jgi:hypothetical protein
MNNTQNLTEKEKLNQNTENAFAELVKSIANLRKENLVAIVSRYDQEHLTREELVNLLVAEITRI